MIPGFLNRIGFDGNGGPYSLVQLKVMQECITLVVFWSVHDDSVRPQLTSDGIIFLAFVLLIGAVVSCVYMDNKVARIIEVAAMSGGFSGAGWIQIGMPHGIPIFMPEK